MSDEAGRKSSAGRLGDLYRSHAQEASRLAYLLTGDRALAEDLVQDAFVRLFGRFRDLRNPEAFQWYLRRTVVNLSRSHFRRRRAERTALEREAARPQPATTTADQGERDRLWRAMGGLPERQRAAIVLRYYEDLTEAQTAEVLGCPVGTVKSWVSRGMTTLRERLSSEVG